MKTTVTSGTKKIEIDLADCIGVTEKQADYADSCKMSIFSKFASMGVNVLESKLYDAINAKYAEQLQILKNNTDARFWIDNKDNTIQSLIKELLSA